MYLLKVLIFVVVVNCKRLIDKRNFHKKCSSNIQQ